MPLYENSTHKHVKILKYIQQYSNTVTPWLMWYQYQDSKSECCSWLWSLIIFLIQRSLLSAVFIPHEVFTPQKYVHSSTRGSAEGGYPLCGVRGPIPRLGGLGASGPPAGVRGRSPRSKNCLIKVYCNFIVNLDRSL
jgi:hypothetical protein